MRCPGTRGLRMDTLNHTDIPARDAHFHNNWRRTMEPMDRGTRRDRSDARKARPHHGRRQRPFHRLGHRQDPGRARRGTRLHLSGRGARQARGAAGAVARLRSRRPLRRGGHRLGRRGVRDPRPALGRPRLRGPRHRLLRQVAAQGLLCGRHHSGEFLPHHGDLLLLLHGDRPARGQAHEERRLAAHPHLWRLDPGHAELQRDGRGQGGARSLRALHRVRSRARRASAATPSRRVPCARSPAPASRMRA